MSKNFNKIKDYYDKGLWTDLHVYNVVGLNDGITEDEFEIIVGVPYKDAPYTPPDTGHSFVAQYGVTTLEELKKAYDEKKTIYVEYFNYRKEVVERFVAFEIRYPKEAHQNMLLYCFCGLNRWILTNPYTTDVYMFSVGWAPSSSDNGWKVELIEQEGVLVDQEFNGNSQNAQSGIAINQALIHMGEQTRLLDFNSKFNATIPSCTKDIENTQIPKVTIDIDLIDPTGALGDEYAVASLSKYEIYDAETGGSRVNCWPVCMFSENKQRKLSLRFVCSGTTDKSAKRIQGAILLQKRTE